MSDLVILWVSRKIVMYQETLSRSNQGFKPLSETQGHITFITETPHMVFCESETDGAT